MSREFIYEKVDGSISRPVTLETVMRVAGKRITSGDGPFTLTQDGDPVVSDVARMVALKKLRHRLTVGDIGPVYRVRNDRSRVVFKVRETKPAIDIVDTNGNDKADLFWSTIKAEFGGYSPRFAGAYVCKQVSGSSTLSQHSYGNAVDIFFNTLAHQEAVANWVVAHADELSIEHAISGDRIWTRGIGWHYYAGDKHYHLHVDFTPSYSGPCGVRG
jgi:hypothetical protein